MSSSSSKPFDAWKLILGSPPEPLQEDATFNIRKYVCFKCVDRIVSANLTKYNFVSYTYEGGPPSYQKDFGDGVYKLVKLEKNSILVEKDGFDVCGSCMKPFTSGSEIYLIKSNNYYSEIPHTDYDKEEAERVILREMHSGDLPRLRLN